VSAPVRLKAVRIVTAGSCRGD